MAPGASRSPSTVFPMASRPAAPGPINWVRIRYEYECTARPVRQIAIDHAVSRSALNARVAREGWTRRRPRVAGEAAPAAAAGIAAQVQRTVERELAAIDAILARLADAGEPTPAAERTARTLASLTRTLKEVQRLRAAETDKGTATQVPAADDDDDDMPRDIDEFRRELARRIDAFVASRTDAGVPERNEE